jgi:hypothetical protein
MGTFGGAQPIVTDGLVFAVDAANYQSYPGSGTTWSDLSGNGNNGTLVNGPTYDGMNGGSIVFDGTNDHILINDQDNLDFSNEITIEYVFKFTNPPPGYAYHIVSKAINSSTSNANFVDYLLKDYGGVRLAYNGHIIGKGWKRLSPHSQELNSNQWYHALWSYNYLTGGKLWVNNILATGGSSNTGVLSINNEPLRMGHVFYGGHNYLKGNVATLKIYNRALTTQEVSQNYNALKGRFGL